MERVFNEIANKIRQNLDNHVLKRLSILGYNFENNYEIESFFKNRIKCVHIGNFVGFYLDFVDLSNRGELLFEYNNDLIENFINNI